MKKYNKGRVILKRLVVALSLILIGIIGFAIPTILFSSNQSHSQTKDNSTLLESYVGYINQQNYKSKDVYTEDDFIYSVYENGNHIGLMEYSLYDIKKNEVTNEGSFVFLSLKGNHNNYIALKLNSSIQESSYFLATVEGEEKKFHLNREIKNQDSFVIKVDFDPHQISNISIFNDKDIKIFTLSK